MTARRTRRILWKGHDRNTVAVWDDDRRSVGRRT